MEYLRNGFRNGSGCLSQFHVFEKRCQLILKQLYIFWWNGILYFEWYMKYILKSLRFYPLVLNVYIYTCTSIQTRGKRLQFWSIILSSIIWIFILARLVMFRSFYGVAGLEDWKVQRNHQIWNCKNNFTSLLLQFSCWFCFHHQLC